MPPVTGGAKRKRVQAPRMSGGGDQTVIAYSAPGNVITTDANGQGKEYRRYIPGYGIGLSNSIGSDLVAAYSSAKFLPGTKIRWEPSVSFSTSGRVFVGFTDNPEVMVAAEALSNTAYANFIRGLGNVTSFPVWQETEISFPTRLRRKRFDTNSTATTGTVDIYDRSAQTFMFVWIEGVPATTATGAFWFHDRVDVEGIHPLIT